MCADPPPPGEGKEAGLSGSQERVKKVNPADYLLALRRAGFLV
jgi:hypothetical protein